MLCFSSSLCVCLCTHTYIHTHICIWTWIHPKEEYILRKTYVDLKNSFTHPTSFWKPLWFLQVSVRGRRGDLTEGSWVSWAIQIVQQGSEIEPQPSAASQTKQKGHMEALQFQDIGKGLSVFLLGWRNLFAKWFGLKEGVSWKAKVCFKVNCVGKKKISVRHDLRQAASNPAVTNL